MIFLLQFHLAFAFGHSGIAVSLVYDQIICIFVPKFCISNSSIFALASTLLTR